LDSKIRIIIADDNLDAQEIMKTFIEPIHTFEIIDYAENGERLIDLNVNLKPDLILADINMPKLSGIESISACLKINPEVKFIFTTAFDEYAVKAFDLNAVDYLIKPIKKERLYVALEKVRTILNNNKKEEKIQILTILVDRTPYFIHFHRIISIEKDNRKTVIHTEEQKYITNETLENIFNKLDNQFMRTHRSFIVNINHISHITLESETYFAHFRNYPHYAHVSKLRVNELLEKLSS
jgi:two-component system, LytTR family, response regulator